MAQQQPINVSNTFGLLCLTFDTFVDSEKLQESQNMGHIEIVQQMQTEAQNFETNHQKQADSLGVDMDTYWTRKDWYTEVDSWLEAYAESYDAAR